MCLRVAEAFYHGKEGFPEDTIKAEHWYTLSANEGYDDAEHSLGYVCDKKGDISIRQRARKG